MPKKILIIDDEVDVMKMLVYRLKARGFEVLTASYGQEGIDLAKVEIPDLIILDYRLPDMMAGEVSSKLREEKKLKQIPIILITATVEEVETKAKECHAVDYLTKPTEPEDLYKKVEKYL